MKKLLVLFLVLFSITSCAYKNTLLREKEESFIYKDNAIEVFRDLGCNKYKNILIAEAKYQIGQQNNLGVAYKLMAMEYFDLAMHEYYDMGDKIDGEYFFLKAKATAEYKYPFPENLNSWSIERKNYKDLKWAREDLLSSIYNGGFSKNPIDLAKAQVIFDSWSELQSEKFDEIGVKALQQEFKYRINRSFLFNEGNVTKEDVNTIYQEFLNDENSAYIKFSELRNIYNKLLTPVVEETPEVVEEQTEKIIEDTVIMEESVTDSGLTVNKVNEDEYSIYFDWNFTAPQDCDRDKIQEIVDSFKDGEYNVVIIKAYTDRSGPAKVNDKISKERGQVIKTMLVSMGIDEKVISVLSFGEEYTPGKDGVKNPEYRKVIVNLVD